MRSFDKIALTSVAELLLEAAGVPAPAAKQVADALIEADCEGTASHGLALLPMYLERIRAGSVDPTAVGKIISDDRGAIVIDAQNGLGQVTAHQAVNLVIESCGNSALSAAAIRNGFHIGALGYWARSIARADCIGVVTSNTRPLLPPPGGLAPVVGNNPIAIAIPARDEILVLDFALSAGAMGKIRLAAAEGKSIPEGWATDSQGQPTTDPEKAIAGLLQAAGGAKGFGLAFMIELIAGGLSGGAIGEQVSGLYGDMSKPYRASHFFLAINIASFIGIDRFKSAASELAHRVRVTPSAAGGQVRLFGDRAIEFKRNHRDTVPLAESTANSIAACAKSLAVELPSGLNL